MLRKYTYRRYLPHFQKDNRAVFATFNTHRRWILPPSARDIVFHCCLHAHERKCTLHGFVIMPDHAHLVFTPMCDNEGPVSVMEIMQSIKSESAHRINRHLGRKGPVWQDESFDHVLRHAESIERAVEYLMENPVAAGLAAGPHEYRWFWAETVVATSSALAQR